MSRYVVQPRRERASDDWWEPPLMLNLHVDGPANVDTGLVDVGGNPIFRVPPPIGFGRDEEW